MAYIPPNSTIQLFKNIPLNPDYENTYYFHKREDDVGETGQTNFFGNLAVATFTAQSYTRKEKGVIKLQAQYENVYDCCYMRFRNTSFEYKWFYAFILKVEYINNETVEITFQIDVMQTWLPNVDYTFEDCFIEREHTADDEYFKNLTPENLDYGDRYILNSPVDEFSFHEDDEGNSADFYVGMIAGKNSFGQTPDTQAGDRLYNNVYFPLYLYALSASDMTTKLARYAGTSAPIYDDIIALYMYPKRFGEYDPDITTPGGVAPLFPFPSIYTHGKNITTNLTTIDGYQPYNRKLFNYPYTFLSVSNNNGKIAEYKWEGWTSGETYDTSGGDLSGLLGKLGRFDIHGCLLPPVTAMLFPSHYNQFKRQIAYDVPSYDDNNYDEGLIMDNFPQCPWVGDTYKAWLAQNKASLVTNLIASTVGTAASVATMTVAPWSTPLLAQAALGMGAAKHIATIGQVMGKISDAKNMPTEAKGQILSEYLTAGKRRFKYSFYPLSITKEYAEKIDMYFQMYGYASHAVKKPYMHHRQKWWYTKTIGCDIVGNIPADDKDEICKLYDSGIRFWWDKARMGIYNTANITRTPD